MKKSCSLLICSLFLLLASGCSEEEQPPQISATEENKQTESETEKHTETLTNEETAAENVIVGPPLPKTLKELENLPSGYTGVSDTFTEEGKKLTNELTKNLPDISDNPTTEQLDRYYEAILSVYQDNFIGPEALIKKLKFESIGSPDIEDSRYQFKENLNVVVILDASGSMANLEGGQTRMDAAKTAILEFVKGLPEIANVGLRIYGHKGTGNNADKALSCSSSELVYPISNYHAETFEQALTMVKPAGWTPIELALSEAQKDLATFKGDTNTNIIYLVSDGISTCDDNPVDAAKVLYDSDITPIFKVIGFNVDYEGQKQLQDIANATEGTYKTVTDIESLKEQLNEANQVALKWEKWKLSKEVSLSYKKVLNSNEVYFYYTGEISKRIYEGQRVGFALTYLYQDQKKMSREAHDYLKQKNTDYHNWIVEEYDKLNADLKAMNEMNYTEAIKELENKYLQNTSTP